MSEKIQKFAQRVNEAFPEISVDALIALWDVASTDRTCKHKFTRGKNANTQCKAKVKEGGEYCKKHSKQ
jgi:hypothetical protein